MRLISKLIKMLWIPLSYWSRFSGKADTGWVWVRRVCESVNVNVGTIYIRLEYRWWQLSRVREMPRRIIYDQYNELWQPIFSELKWMRIKGTSSEVHKNGSIRRALFLNLVPMELILRTHWFLLIDLVAGQKLWNLKLEIVFKAQS